MRSEKGQVGAEVSQGADPQGEESAVLVEGKLGRRDIVARLVVGQKSFRAIAGPLHGPSQLLGRVQAEDVLAVGSAPHSEGAAHVVTDHAQPVLRHVQDGLGHRLAHAVRPLGTGVERKAFLELVVLADAGAGLHRCDRDAADHELESRDVMSLVECRIGGGPVTLLEHEADVVRALLPNRDRTVVQHFRGRGGGRQNLVVDLHLLGRGTRLDLPARHHECHVVADEPHPIGAQGRVPGQVHRRPVGTVPGHRAWDIAEPRARDVLTRIDREHARRRRRLRAIYRSYPGVSVRRTHHVPVQLIRPVEVVGVPAAAPEQPRVLPAWDSLSDSELAHRRPRRASRG